MFNQSTFGEILLRSSGTQQIDINQQIGFAGKLEEDDGATMFFITEKQQKMILNFSLNSLIVTE